MSISKIALAAAATTILLTNSAVAGNFVNGGQPKLKVKNAQLAIQSPGEAACPAPAKMAGWIFTNKPGSLQYMIARKGGTVSGPFTVESKKGANGLSMASFSKEFPVHASVDAEYRILVGEKYGKTLSNWAPLSVSCN